MYLGQLRKLSKDDKKQPAHIICHCNQLLVFSKIGYFHLFFLPFSFFCSVPGGCHFMQHFPLQQSFTLLVDDAQFVLITNSHNYQLISDIQRGGNGNHYKTSTLLTEYQCFHLQLLTSIRNHPGPDPPHTRCIKDVQVCVVGFGLIFIFAKTSLLSCM